MSTIDVKCGPLVARIMEDKTGKVFMTGYIEGFTKNFGWRNQTQKRQKESEAKQKNHSPKQTAQSRESRLPSFPAQNNGPVLQATTAAVSGHWVWHWPHSHCL